MEALSGLSQSWGLQLWLHAQQGHCEEVEMLLEHVKLLLKREEEEEEEGAAARRANRDSALETVGRALHVSVANDHATTAAALWACRPPIRVRKHVTAGHEAVHLAAVLGSCAVLRMLLAAKADADVQCTGGRGVTPLVLASNRGHLGAVQVLLAHRAAVDAPTRCETTALMRAAVWGPVDVVEILLESKAQVNLCPRHGHPALTFACSVGNVAKAALLLHAKAQVDATAGPVGTPLSWAACNGRSDTVALLLRHRATVDSVTAQSETPLTKACHHGQVSAAALLLDAGAFLEHADRDGHTPLACAVRGRHVATVALLLERKANLESRDNMGRTPLAECARPLVTTAALRILGINAEDNMQGCVVMARVLLDAKADVDAVGDRGECAVLATLLHNSGSGQ